MGVIGLQGSKTTGLRGAQYALAVSCSTDCQAQRVERVYAGLNNRKYENALTDRVFPTSLYG